MESVVSALVTFFFPLYFMYLPISFLPSTLLQIFRTKNITAFTSFSEFKEVWFAVFWAWYGAANMAPLLRTHARGVILDVGPGAGNWLSLFTEVVRDGKVRKIYGVEPNQEHHMALNRRVKEAGLEGVYEVLGAKAADLRSMKGIGENDLGISKGSVDTIVTLQVLCSVPQPRLLIHDLYEYLKPGGHWIVYEHVKTRFRGQLVEYWQNLLNLVWPHLFNGCNITRDTIGWITREGQWKHIQVGDRIGATNREFEAVPGIQGFFVKSETAD